jgi:UDP-3-O-[3-hydroxymyristoyl] glucosamine N-acyltransferase
LYTLAKLAALVNGRVAGNSARRIHGVSEIRDGKPDTITFLANPKYHRYLEKTLAVAAVVSDEKLLNGKDGIIVDDPQLAISKILELFAYKKNAAPEIHKTAIVNSSVKLGRDVTIGPYSIVEANVSIGDESSIGAHSIIEEGSQVGDYSTIQSNVTIYHHCTVGNHCLIQSGTVIGSRGFGFVTDKDKHHPIPQNGSVIVEDDVEIGANCAIDRGTIGNTVVGSGTKIDNLVQIAHNVKIGKGCLLSGQVGIAGSVEIGDFCIFAGKVGVAHHVKIGNRAIFAAKTGVTKSLPGGKTYSGMPAREIREQNRRAAVYNEVQILKKRMKSLEKKVIS